MSLKKLLLVSTCALTLGAATTIGGNTLFSQDNIVYAQDQPTETGLTEQEIQQVTEIKNNLAGVQPVNLEQLLNISDTYLIDLFDTATTEAQTNPEVDVWTAMYNHLAVDYAELNLLTGENYEAYNRAAEVIVASSEYSYSDLNTSLPSDILTWYQAASAENGENIAATVEAILPQITGARDAYMQRRADRENTVENEVGEETPAPEDEFNAAISEFTDITTEQLAQFSEEELEPIKLGSANGSYSQETMQIIRGQIIQLNPDVFTDEQVSSVANDIRTAFIQSTPATQEQLDQLDNHYLVAMVGEGNQLGADIGWAYGKAVGDNQEVFEAEATRFRTTLIEEFNLNEQELSQVPDSELLWAEFGIFQNNDQQENIEELSVLLQEDYGISTTVEESSSESSTSQESESTSEETSSEESSSVEESDGPESELGIYLETLVNQTDLTIEQLENFSNEHIQVLMNRLGYTTDSTSADELNALRDEIILSGYENFDASQIAQALAPLKEAMIARTPATEGILGQVSDEVFAEWYNEAKNNSYDAPSHVFQQLITENTDLFNNLVIEAKQKIIENTTITQEQVDQMQSVDILWAVQPNDAGEVNYIDVTNYLTERYPSVIGEDNESSEESSEEASSSVNVSISSSIEEKDGVLPNTGENSSIWIIIVAALALVGGGIYLLVSGRSKHKN